MLQSARRSTLRRRSSDGSQMLMLYYEHARAELLRTQRELAAHTAGSLRSSAMSAPASNTIPLTCAAAAFAWRASHRRRPVRRARSPTLRRLATALPSAACGQQHPPATQTRLGAPRLCELCARAGRRWKWQAVQRPYCDITVAMGAVKTRLHRVAAGAAPALAAAASATTPAPAAQAARPTVRCRASAGGPSCSSRSRLHQAQSRA